jgi:hypothetical protein
MNATNPSKTKLTGSTLLLARISWFALAALTVGLVVLALPARFADLQVVSPVAEFTVGQLRPADAEALAQLGLTPLFYAWFFTLLEATSAAMFIIVAAVIFWRRSAYRIPLLIATGLLPFGAIGSPWLDSLVIEQPEFHFPVLLLRIIGLALFILTLYRFPDGKFVPAWTRWLVAAWVIFMVGWIPFPVLRIEMSLFATTPAEVVRKIWMLTVMVTLGLSQIYRYFRTLDPVVRQQTKWFVFGTAVTLVLTLLVGLPLLLVPALRQSDPLSMAYRMVAFTITLLAELTIVTSIGLSILRYRLWDIDVLIRRTLIYTALTGTLVVVYFVSVVLLQRVFTLLIQEGSPLAVVLSTLLIAALFNPLRQRIQNDIDRLFFRRKYDAEQTLAAFNAAVRDEVDLENLSKSLLTLVDETMQPEGASLWIRTTDQ